MADCSYLDEFAEYVEEKKGMANAKVHFTTTKPLDAIFQVNQNSGVQREA